MFKRAVFVLVAVLLTAVFAGSAFAASHSLSGASRVVRPTGMIWGGGPSRIQVSSPSQGGLGTRRFNSKFPTTFPDPVNHFNWSEFLGWIQNT